MYEQQLAHLRQQQRSSSSTVAVQYDTVNNEATAARTNRCCRLSASHCPMLCFINRAFRHRAFSEHSWRANRQPAAAQRVKKQQHFMSNNQTNQLCASRHQRLLLVLQQQLSPVMLYKIASSRKFLESAWVLLCHVLLRLLLYRDKMAHAMDLAIQKEIRAMAGNKVSPLAPTQSCHACITSQPIDDAASTAGAHPVTQQQICLRAHQQLVLKYSLAAFAANT